MKTLFFQNKLFFICCSVFWIVAGIYLLTHGKGDFSLYLNKHHSATADLFFRYATWMGDGITITIICLLLLFVKFRYVIITSIISILSSFLVNIVKNIAHQPRPVEYFKTEHLNFVQGVELFHWHSFPSGHTAAAFAMFCLFGFFVRNKLWSVLFFLLALSVAISRVYIFQHFLVDVYFGSMFGVINAIWIYLVLGKMGFLKKGWAERSVFHLKGNSEY